MGIKTLTSMNHDFETKEQHDGVRENVGEKIQYSEHLGGYSTPLDLEQNDPNAAKKKPRTLATVGTV